jgi:modulator of FtsH protease HflC
VTTGARSGWQARARWIGTALLLFALPTTVVFVDETEHVIIERLGRIVAVYDRDPDRGLHFKAPWPIDMVRRFDRRLQLFTPPGREVFTRDRKNLIVEAFVCWQIADGPAEMDRDFSTRPVVQFFRSLGTNEVAEARLGSRLQSILTTQLGQRSLTDLVHAENSTTAPPPSSTRLSQVAEELKQQVLQRPDEAAPWTDRLGLNIIDVRIHRLSLPTANQHAVYERMRSERQKMAERYRSAGLAESQLIRSQADRQAGEILSRANAEAEKIRGAGEAEALRTLNAAYARDPEFAQRLQALDAYREMVSEKTTLIFSLENPIWRWLNDGLPIAPVAPAETKP